MGSASIWCAVGLWVVLALTMVPQQSWARQSQICVSSCGKIPNITHPFRRKDDPPNCGDSRYELECVNDVAVLRLSRAEYHVQAINYNNYTIRLVDPNIQEDNCSSTPRYFLYKNNFSDVMFGYDSNYHADVDLYHATQNQGNGSLYDYSSVPLSVQIIYMSCSSIVKEYASHVANNTTSCLDVHTYVVVAAIYGGGWRWEPGCHIKLIAATSGLFQLQQQYYSYFGDWNAWALSKGSDQAPNISYGDIHRALSYGFELSWLHATCNCGSRPCYLNDTNQKVICLSGFCSNPYHSVHHCGKNSNIF